MYLVPGKVWQTNVHLLMEKELFRADKVASGRQSVQIHPQNYDPDYNQKYFLYSEHKTFGCFSHVTGHRPSMDNIISRGAGVQFANVKAMLQCHHTPA